MGYEPEPNPAISRVSSERLASYVTGVIATLVAIGGLYLISRLQATTAIAMVGRPEAAAHRAGP